MWGDSVRGYWDKSAGLTDRRVDHEETNYVSWRMMYHDLWSAIGKFKAACPCACTEEGNLSPGATHMPL